MPTERSKIRASEWEQACLHAQRAQPNFVKQRTLRVRRRRCGSQPAAVRCKQTSSWRQMPRYCCTAGYFSVLIRTYPYLSVNIMPKSPSLIHNAELRWGRVWRLSMPGRNRTGCLRWRRPVRRRLLLRGCFQWASGRFSGSAARGRGPAGYR